MFNPREPEEVTLNLRRIPPFVPVGKNYYYFFNICKKRFASINKMTAIAIGESTSLVNFNVIFYKRAERLNFCIFFYFLCETIYKRLIPAFQCVAVKHHQMNFSIL